ncbi:PAS domain S-box protein [Microvirga sp. BSC39]|uniref:PAS domain S-box protein n=1 Tax=Microvirga sp. BSC39 TaxID=1549810 RepID=UPI00068FB610|nr:PAS domain S-box protein [Microvirga sp. BSC39]
MNPTSAIRRRALSTRARLVLLVTAVLIPVVVFAAALLWQFAATERQRHQAEAQELSQRVSAAIDRELDGLMAALEALSTSPALQAGGDLGAFDAQARALLRTRGSFVAMRDATGQQIINTSRPFGAPLPVSTDPVVRATDRQVFDTGKPVVSDLYTGAATGLRLVLIDAPVLRDGKVAYALNIALDPARLSQILASSTLPDWTTAIVDRNDRIIARSRQHERFVGNEATSDLKINTMGQGGTWLGTTLEGTEVLGGYTRSTLSGWRVAVGVPTALIEAPLRRMTWLVIGSAAVVLVLSIGLAFWFARRIAGPLRQLAEVARRVGQGEQVPALATGLREANEIGDALAAASTALREREEERDRAQALSRELAALVENSFDFIGVSDTDLNALYVNDAGRDLVGLDDKDEVRRSRMLDYFDPSEHERIREEVIPAVADKGRWSGELTFRHFKTGERISVIYDVFRIDDPQTGRPIRYGTVTRDITERKRAEERLAESEARLKTVFDTVPVGIIVAEAPSGRITDGNAQVERIFGHPVLTSKDVEGYHEWISYHADGRMVEAAEYPLSRVLKAGEERPELEVLYQRGDGRQTWVHIIGAPIRDASGRITGGLVACLDIDRQKRAEAELRELNTTLEQRVEDAIAERDRIWRLSAEIMLIARFDGEIVAVNPAWSAILGWTEAELIGTSFLDLVHPDDKANTMAEAGRLSEGLTTLRFDNRYRHKDGSYRWLSWTAVPDRRFIHAIARDITGEREAAEILRKTEEQLRQSQKMEVVGQLTGGVAHDFNNLLTVITGHLEIAHRKLDAGQGDVRLMRNIQNAMEGAQRAATLTHRLLAFSRQSPLQPEMVDLNKLVSGMSELIRRTLGETISIETVLAGGLWRTEADPNQAENAVLNLCVNARDAMPEGGKLTIETANTHLDETYPAVARGEIKAGQYVMVAVCDTGAGMSPEIRDRVFEPFFTTKPVGKGTGLGLSQVYGFLRQTGGHAVIYSEVGEGTTVKLYFPRFTRQSREKSEEALQPPTPLQEGNGEVILVVEDEDMVREFTVSALEEAGYTVLAAADGPSGLALLRSHPEVDLLFTDVVLAGPLNGRKVADEARKLRPELKVLFTTGYTRNAIVHHGRLDEGVNLITKPFTRRSLTDKVKRVLESE